MLRFNLILVGLCVGAGALWGWDCEPLFPGPRGHWGGNDILTGLFTDLSVILARNSRVIGLVLLGSGTFGIVTIMVLAWNSLFLGFHLHSLWLVSPGEVFYAALYVPLEFLSICIIASGSESLGLWMLRRLISDEGRLSGPSFSVFTYWAVGCALAFAAALLEVLAKALRICLEG